MITFLTICKIWDIKGKYKGLLFHTISEEIINFEKLKLKDLL